MIKTLFASLVASALPTAAALPADTELTPSGRSTHFAQLPGAVDGRFRAPSGAAGFVRYPNTNCFPPSTGANRPPVPPALGTNPVSLEFCKQECIKTPTCEGFVRNVGPSPNQPCVLVSEVNLGQCDGNDQNFDLYLDTAVVTPNSLNARYRLVAKEEDLDAGLNYSNAGILVTEQNAYFPNPRAFSSSPKSYRGKSNIAQLEFGDVNKSPQSLTLLNKYIADKTAAVPPSLYLRPGSRLEPGAKIVTYNASNLGELVFVLSPKAKVNCAFSRDAHTNFRVNQGCGVYADAIPPYAMAFLARPPSAPWSDTARGADRSKFFAQQFELSTEQQVLSTFLCDDYGQQIQNSEVWTNSECRTPPAAVNQSRFCGSTFCAWRDSQVAPMLQLQGRILDNVAEAETPNVFWVPGLYNEIATGSHHHHMRLPQEHARTYHN